MSNPALLTSAGLLPRINHSTINALYCLSVSYRTFNMLTRNQKAFFQIMTRFGLTFCIHSDLYFLLLLFPN